MVLMSSSGRISSNATNKQQQQPEQRQPAPTANLVNYATAASQLHHIPAAMYHHASDRQLDGCSFNTIALMEPLGFRPSSVAPAVAVSVTKTLSTSPAVTTVGGSASGRTYHCQRCLNHGKEVARKGHKRYCEWANCICVQCVLVEKRKMLNREINSECERSQQLSSSSSSSSSSSNGSDREGGGQTGAVSKRKSRNPKCARCGVHNRHAEPPPLKGHKKVCPYQTCTCYKCQLVTQRRSVMARQIHLRRSQKARQNNNSSSALPADGEQLSKQMTPISSADTVVSIHSMGLGGNLQTGYGLELVSPSHLMAPPSMTTANNVVDHNHPAFVFPSRPTPTYVSGVYNACQNLIGADRWIPSSRESYETGRSGLLVPSLLGNWETAAWLSGGAGGRGGGSQSLFFRPSTTSVGNGQHPLLDVHLTPWVPSGCWPIMDVGNAATCPMFSGRPLLSTPADFDRLSMHLNQLFAIKNVGTGRFDNSILLSQSILSKLPV